MKKLFQNILLTSLLLTALTLTGCGSAADPSVPEALQEPNGGLESYTYGNRGRSHSDLVDELFTEILEKRPEVKAIVDEQANMLENISEEIDQLHQFDSKSDQFYASARSHADLIADSISRVATLARIDDSENRWHASLAERDAISLELSQQRHDLKDELVRLKIRLTMPQIEDYQRKNQPNLNESKALEKQTSRLMRQMQAIPEK